MPLRKYGVLVGKAVAAVREDGEDTPHYQIRIKAANTDYRIAVNVKSKSDKPELLYLVDERFEHPILSGLLELSEGFTSVSSKPGGVALDYIRGNLFDKDNMRPLPHSLPGPDNDLSDRIEHFAKRAIEESDARVFAFGKRWGPEPGRPDQVFQFEPGNGIHDIHMNQSNNAEDRRYDGVWQDGGLIFHFPATEQWDRHLPCIPVPGLAHGRRYGARYNRAVDDLFSLVPQPGMPWPRNTPVQRL